MTIECIRYTEYASGALIGFADLWIPNWGIEISGCSVFSKDNRRWVSLPSREYADKTTNEKKYAPIVLFREKGLFSEFGKAALQAIDDWIIRNPPANTPEPTSDNTNVRPGETVPF